MLQVIFGEDEHTAADGPYNRLLKARKWLYLASAAGLAVSEGLYHDRAALDLLRIVSAPTQHVKHTLFLSITYLLVQYLLLAIQLITTYDIVLSERFTFRRAEELAKAKAAVREAETELVSSLTGYTKEKQRLLGDEQVRAATTLRQAEDEARHAEQKLAAEKVGSSRVQQTQAQHERSRARAALALARREARRLQVTPAVPTDADPVAESEAVASSKLALEEARALLNELQSQVPAARRGYRLSEIAFDVTRLLPPMIFGAYTAARLLSW